MKLTGAEILMQGLKDEGVDTIFGYPGGAVLDLYDALVKTEGLKHILVRHEQGAVHAADAYARALGKTGVCLVTSGPGATNTVTGLASAYCDSIPIVAITGQVSTSLIGNDAFQEVDIVGITRPCTKHNYLVKNIDDLAQTIREAFYIASSGRPGPVLIDIPKNLMTEKAEYTKPKEKIFIRSYNPNCNPNPKQLVKALELLKTAKKPLIFSGGGVVLSKASEELTKLAETMQIPVTSSLMGLGAFSGTSSLWTGMPGMHGTYCANMAISECDVMIGVGVRFDDRVTGKISSFATNSKKIQIDIDPTSIHKNVKVDIPIVADCKESLKKFNELIAKEKFDFTSLKKERKEWLNQIEKWKKDKPLSYKQDKIIKPQFVVEKLYELTGGKAIITTEVGQNQMWAAQFYNFDKPNHFITSGGLGVMGFGLPAAIGAQVACPNSLVVDIAGDGSIQMNIQEMATAVQHNLPVKIVILNNGYLGMVRQWQELFYKREYAHTRMEFAPDFVKLAEAYGAVGLRTDKVSEVEKVLKEGLNNKRTTIMDFVVAKEEGVYPMIPSGKTVADMLLV